MDRYSPDGKQEPDNGIIRIALYYNDGHNPLSANR
jgi:hypothetical protein